MYYESISETGRIIVYAADGVRLFIPPDPANTDYQRYLAWVAEGNTAEVVES